MVRFLPASTLFVFTLALGKTVPGAEFLKSNTRNLDGKESVLDAGIIADSILTLWLSFQVFVDRDGSHLFLACKSLAGPWNRF